MKRGQWLNSYHRAYCERMQKLETARSKQPPMSPAEFMAQAKRLRRGSGR
jgi:hypothetical protein